MTAMFMRLAGERPDFWRVPVFLWGEGVDFDSDGNSRTHDDRHWTELTVILRPDHVERVDVDPVPGNETLLVVQGSSPELAARTAWYLATESGGAVATSEAGPYLEPSSIRAALGEFDADSALRLARAQLR